MTWRSVATLWFAACIVAAPFVAGWLRRRGVGAVAAYAAGLLLLGAAAVVVRRAGGLGF